MSNLLPNVQLLSSTLNDMQMNGNIASITFTGDTGNKLNLDANPTVDYNVKLPATKGTSGQILVYDGVDQCTWTTTTPQLTVTGTLSSSQILGLNSTPITLVTAQGAGTIIQVDKISLNYIYNSTTYASGGAISAIYGTNTAKAATGTAAASVITGTSNGFATLLPTAIAQNGTLTDYVNKAISLSNATGAFTTGNGTIAYKVFYTVLSGIQ